jgi:hypothetical protein
MRQINHEQYSAEWFAARLGKFTSSTIWQLIVEPKEKAKKEAGELSSTAKEYVMTKVAERLTGVRKEFSNDATAHGVEYEPKAIQLYELHTGNVVTPCTYIEAIEGVYGGTPDGLVGNDGSIQVKCPFDPKNHLYFAMTGDQEHFKRKYREYYWQVQSDMFVSNTQWCDFISYCPFMPSGKELYIMRIQRNEDDIAILAEAITKAYIYLKKILQELDNKFYG